MFGIKPAVEIFPIFLQLETTFLLNTNLLALAAFKIGAPMFNNYNWRLPSSGYVFFLTAKACKRSAAGCVWGFCPWSHLEEHNCAFFGMLTIGTTWV